MVLSCKSQYSNKRALEFHYNYFIILFLIGPIDGQWGEWQQTICQPFCGVGTQVGVDNFDKICN